MFYRARNAIGLSIILVMLILGTACISGNTTSAAPRTTSPTFQTSGGSFISTLQGQNSTINGDNQGQESSILDFDSQNTSEINIDVSDFTELIQSFSFAINRQKHFVRVISADGGDSIQAAGDLKATVTVEVLDAQAIPVFNGDANDLGSLPPTSFAVVYNDDLIQVFDVGDDGTRPRAEIAIINLDNPPDASGFRRAAKQVTISGAVVTLNVEALDNARGADTETIEQEGGLNVFGASGEDKQQRVIDLVGKTQSGRVNFNVRIRGSEDGCPEPCKVASLSPNNESDNPPPENPPEPEKADPDPNDGNAPEANEGPQEAPLPSDPSDGQSNSGNSNSPENSENNQQSQENNATSNSEIANPEIPEGEQTTFVSGGNLDPNLDNIDVVLIIDDSSSVRTRDFTNERLDAARAYLSASLSGDLIGVTHFSHVVYSEDLLELQNGGPIISNKQKELTNSIDNIITGGTGFGSRFSLALDKACKTLESQGRHAKRAAILLSNDEVVGVSEMITGLAEECFRRNNWPIYVYGVDAARADFFQRMADQTGGAFIPVSDLPTLVCKVQGARSLIVGGVEAKCTPGNIVTPDKKKPPLEVQVPPAMVKATFTLSWDEGEGNELYMRLVPPPGARRTFYIKKIQVPAELAADSFPGATFEVLSITLPEAGTWQIEVNNPSGQTTDYVIGYSFVPLITP